MIYGVDCEKCHGPAAKHVEFEKQNPKDTTGKYIINPALLTRQQSLDFCRLCHGGRLNKTTASFAFQVGDTLSNYFSTQTAVNDADNIDVHGNQYGLLAASKCFRMSQMTCNTCHNPHENETGKIELFSQRCISCHRSGHEPLCKLTRKIGSSISQNCIDCHMPVKPSRAIEVFLQGDDAPTPAKMRSHYIKIYPDETKKMLALLHKVEIIYTMFSLRNSILYCLLISVILVSCHRTNPLFTSLPASQTHIDFVNRPVKKDLLNILYYLYYYNGGGVAIGDINNDGLPDIYFTANNKGHNKLYLNKGNFEFEDITEKAGVAGTSDWCTGVTMADVNGDGLLDIYVCAVANMHGLKGHNELFINNGNGHIYGKRRKIWIGFFRILHAGCFF